MIRILQGDCREMLKMLPDASVQCCVTSPPYFGLRDYGTATWEGGDPACDHLAGRLVSPKSTLRSDGRDHTGPYSNEKTVITGMPYRDICGKCGARRIDQQLGLEQTPAEYVAALVEVFREVRRVLKPDGICWIVIGDSYASSPPGNKTVGVSASSTLNGVNGSSGRYRETLAGGHATKRDTSKIAGLKPKDLIGIPWRVAFALQEDGWWLRSEIIWHKIAPMPESVRDRPTRAHEQVFLLTKSATYFYNAKEARDPLKDTSIARLTQPTYDEQKGSDRANGGAKTNGTMKAVPAQAAPTDGANWRDVWPIATSGFDEAHFAVMPARLAERCIKAGSRRNDTVLDPFAGAFTTALVANRLQRNAIGIELNADYVVMARARIEQDAGIFADIVAETPPLPFQQAAVD